MHRHFQILEVVWITAEERVMRTIEEQAGGNLFRAGQRKRRLIAIKRERTGMGKAGHKLCLGIAEDGEGKLASTDSHFSPEPYQSSWVATPLSCTGHGCTTGKQTSYSLWSLGHKEVEFVFPFMTLIVRFLTLLISYSFFFSFLFFSCLILFNWEIAYLGSNKFVINFFSVQSMQKEIHNRVFSDIVPSRINIVNFQRFSSDINSCLEICIPPIFDVTKVHWLAGSIRRRT